MTIINTAGHTASGLLTKAVADKVPNEMQASLVPCAQPLSVQQLANLFSFLFLFIYYMLLHLPVILFEVTDNHSLLGLFLTHS